MESQELSAEKIGGRLGIGVSTLMKVSQSGFQHNSPSVVERSLFIPFKSGKISLTGSKKNLAALHNSRSGQHGASWDTIMALGPTIRGAETASRPVKIVIAKKVACYENP